MKNVIKVTMSNGEAKEYTADDVTIHPTGTLVLFDRAINAEGKVGMRPLVAITQSQWLMFEHVMTIGTAEDVERSAGVIEGDFKLKN